MPVSEAQRKTHTHMHTDTQTHRLPGRAGPLGCISALGSFGFRPFQNDISLRHLTEALPFTPLSEMPFPLTQPLKLIGVSQPALNEMPSTDL